MSQADDLYSFRPYTADDVNFINNSWASSYYGANYKGLISPDEFNSYHRPLRERFFSRSRATVIICSSKESPDLIIGWVALEKLKNCTLLHYIYVKQAFKGEGIGTKLFAIANHLKPVFVTHMTRKADDIIYNKPEDCGELLFKPHLT